MKKNLTGFFYYKPMKNYNTIKKSSRIVRRSAPPLSGSLAGNR